MAAVRFEWRDGTMSYDNKTFMRMGRFVAHRYARRRGRRRVCIRCGTKRRRTSSGWEWRSTGFASSWSSSNPPCALNPRRQP